MPASDLSAAGSKRWRVNLGWFMVLAWGGWCFSASAWAVTPSGWHNADIGAVGVAGSLLETDGTFTVRASGADIWGAADEFHFVYRPLKGDGSITARVVSLTRTHVWAKAGVMVRSSLAANAAHATMVVSAGSGAAFQFRAAGGGTSASAGAEGAAAAPYWVRVERAASVLRGYKSSDGISWTLATQRSIPMGSDVYVGLVATSHLDGTRTSAVFDNVSLVPGAPSAGDTTPPTVPSGLVAQAGEQYVTGQRQSFGVQDKPHSIALADLDRNGKLDVMAASSGTDSVDVLLGDGTTLAPATNWPTGTYPKFAVSGDFNRDGKPDMVTADQNSNTVSVLLGLGGGAFGRATSLPACAANHEVAVGDFNGDGHPDIASACHRASFGGVAVFLGDGTGRFAAAVNVATSGQRAHSLALADFDRNGTLDMVVAHKASNNVSVLLGRGDGRFAPAVTYAAGAGPHSVRVADFNDDGKLDWVTANDTANSITIRLGRGDGTFGRRLDRPVSSAAGVSTKSVAVADLDNDGDTDVMAGTVTYPSCCLAGGKVVSIFLNHGDGTFGVRRDVDTGEGPFSIVAHDVNSDGIRDVLTADWHSDTISLLPGRLVRGVELAWTTSNDGVGTGVAGYRIFRNDIAIATTSQPGFVDTNVPGPGTYIYRITAFDRAVPLNESARSAPLSVRVP